MSEVFVNSLGLNELGLVQMSEKRSQIFVMYVVVAVANIWKLKQHRFSYKNCWQRREWLYKSNRSDHSTDYVI